MPLEPAGPITLTTDRYLMRPAPVPRRWTNDNTPATPVTAWTVRAGGIYRRRLHYGIGLGPDQLIDCSSSRGNRPIRVVTFDQFAVGAAVWELDDSDGALYANFWWTRRYPCRPAGEVVARATAKLDWEGKYDLVGFSGINCIQFALYCKCSDYERPEFVPWTACEGVVKLR